VTPTCPCCGGEIRTQSRFCPTCGTSLEARLVPGALIKGGDYRIVRSLSKGGMGAVFLAEDRRAFERLCVIKQMLEYYDPNNPEEHRRAQQRFEEEGRVLASLSHPGVPKIYAFFSEGGRYYIVMEYIQGETLENYVTHEDETGHTVASRRLPQEEVLRLAIQACRIIEYLHSQPRPVVHQDIKPGNLIRESQLGDVRLVDFGTARAEIPQGAQPGSGCEASIYGTDGYAAPEQYHGKPEPRSDVFALSATLYHLLTDDDPGRHPFTWPKLGALPRELALALEHALRPEPEQRSAARELREAMEAIATPRRTLETFTFPGGARIRTVLALPALCDENWDAARRFLYNGDFQRWLRDINRHDLVLAADAIVKQQSNQDAGLEEFVRVVDFGIAKPKVVTDPPEVALGAVAREAALSRKVSLCNVTRGYTLASLAASKPWIEIFPTTAHLWAGKPVPVRITVRAENLPFRQRQEGTVTIAAADQADLTIPVTAQVSLSREVWRIIRRAILAAIPEGGRVAAVGWRLLSRVASAVGGFLASHSWLIWLLWVLLGAGLSAGLHLMPAFWAQALGQFLGVAFPQRPDLWVAPELWGAYLFPVLLGPPLIFSAWWLAFLVVVVIGGAVFGALRGAWKSFFR
jgi:serine/threonine protein kinase